MPLHLIAGRATAGKTGALYCRVLASLALGESPVVVLPSVADARRAMLEFSGKAPAGVAIVTLERWAEGLWRLHGDGRRIISDAARNAFVTRAILDSDAAVLASVATSQGFSAMISRTVSTTFGDPDTGVAHSEAIRAVARICARYRQLIHASGLIEASEAWKRLGDSPPRLPGLVAVNRFADLSDPAFALLKGLSEVNDVVVALTWEVGFAPTRSLEGTVERLTAVAATVAHVPETNVSGELPELLSRLYTGSGELKSRGSVCMGVAAGVEAETALVAKFAAEAVAAGEAPDRIVVAFPNLGSVVQRIETALSAEGLSYDIDIARPVADTALGRSMSGLLVLAQGGGDRTTALAVLLGSHSDVPADAVARLDRTWRLNRITAPESLLADIARLPESMLGRAADLARQLVRAPVRPANGKKWQAFVNLLLSAGARRLTAAGEVPVKRLAAQLADDAAVARAVVRAIEDMASVEGAPFAAADVRAALRTVVAGGTSGERAGRIQVTELSRLHSRRFDTVIVGGLTAGEMPVGDSEGLADELRALFPATPRAGGEERARYDFYQVISRARGRLVLVRRDADDRGAPVRPSVLWEEVVDAYRVPGESADDWPAAGPALVRVAASEVAVSAPVFTTGRRELRRLAADGCVVSQSPRRGELVDVEVLELLANAETFSATEIEAYLECPYRWFYERVVRPEEIDAEFDARAVGTMAHTLLKAFYDVLPAALGERRVTPENLADAMSLLEQVVAETNTGIAVAGLAEQLDLARAARWVSAAVADDAHVLPRFVPSGHELSFGGADEAAVSLGGVAFKGRIDRIDTSGDAVFVTDYKSSRKVTGHAKFADESKVQAVVYALAATGISGLPVAGSVYRSLRSRQMRGFWRADRIGGALALGYEDDSIGGSCFDELVAQAADRIEAAVAGIRSGRIPREPAKRSACSYCALRRQCGGAA